MKWLQEILLQLDGDHGKCAMKVALVARVGHRASMQCSLALFFQSLYCNVLKKNSVACSQLSAALCG